MSGYYEWQNTPNGKQPWYYTAHDRSALTAAGLWDSWRNPETGKPLLSCTMIITEPNAIAAEIHDRMPVLLTKEQFESWLNGEAGVDLLRPAQDDLLQKWPVSMRVNSSRASAEDATLIARVLAHSDRHDAGLIMQERTCRHLRRMSAIRKTGRESRHRKSVVRDPRADIGRQNLL